MSSPKQLSDVVSVVLTNTKVRDNRQTMLGLSKTSKTLRTATRQGMNVKDVMNRLKMFYDKELAPFVFHMEKDGILGYQYYEIVLGDKQHRYFLKYNESDDVPVFTLLNYNRSGKLQYPAKTVTTTSNIGRFSCYTRSRREDTNKNLAAFPVRDRAILAGFIYHFLSIDPYPWTQEMYSRSDYFDSIVDGLFDTVDMQTLYTIQDNIRSSIVPLNKIHESKVYSYVEPFFSPFTIWNQDLYKALYNKETEAVWKNVVSWERIVEKNDRLFVSLVLLQHVNTSLLDLLKRVFGEANVELTVDGLVHVTKTEVMPDDDT